MGDGKDSVDKLFAQAFDLQGKGNLDSACAHYEKLLAHAPDHGDAWHMLAICHAQSGRLQVAIACFSRAIEIQPDAADVHFNRANAWVEMGVYQQALHDADMALSIEPDHVDGLMTRGIALKELGQLDAALACYDRALLLAPQNAQLLSNKAIVLHQLQRLAESLQSYTQALTLDPRNPNALNNLGILLKELGQLEQAVISYEMALALSPTFVEALNNLGNALNKLRRYEQALAVFSKAISLKPDSAVTYCNRGNSYKGLGRVDEAMADYEKALSMDASNPEALNNKGVLLNRSRNFEQALNFYNQALEHHPHYLDALSNKGLAFYELRQFDEAKQYYDQAIALAPHYQRAQWNKALLCLLLGDYEQGWPLYEAGWLDGLRGTARNFTKPIWFGRESVVGKTVLLHPEQGLGDTIQFCRYARCVKDLGARVVLEAPKPLIPLLKQLDGVDVLVALGDELPEFDVHCPLLSLPMVFQTTLHTIPSPAGYLRAAPEKAAHWAHRLSDDKKFKVGVVWNGGFRQDQPELWAVNERRNIPLSVFAAGFNQLDVSFYSLQKGDPAESEIRGQSLSYWPRGNFYNHTDALQDFSDTAALIANLDLVISVDTSTAHLAAAMGKPTWILNRFDTCWRWLLERDDSPWYDAVRLYRQTHSGDWPPVLARVAQDVKRLL